MDPKGTTDDKMIIQCNSLKELVRINYKMATTITELEFPNELILLEQVDMNKVSQLLTAIELTPTELDYLQKYQKAWGKDPTKPVKYKRKDVGYGRYIIKERSRPNLCDMSRRTRNFLADGMDWTDVDMVDSACAITIGLCQIAGLECQHITDYHNDRQKIIDGFAEYGIDKESFKKNVMCKMLNHKNFNWRAYADTIDIPKNDWLRLWMERIYHNISDIRPQLLDHFGCKKLQKYCHNNKPHNGDGSYFAYLIQTYESYATCKLIDILQDDYGFKVGTYTYDGCIVLDSVPDDIIDECSQKVSEFMGFKVEYKDKEFELYNWTFNTVDGDRPIVKPTIKTEFLKVASMIIQYAKDKEYYRRFIGNDILVLRKKDVPYWAYTVHKSAAEFIHAAVDELGLELMMRNNPSSYDQMTKYLIKGEYKNKDFPLVEFDRDYFGFNDGVYYIVGDEFIPKDKVDPKLFVRNYFDVGFSTVEPEHLIKVAADQGFSQKTLDTLWGLGGRQLFQVNQMDKWEINLVLKGLPGCGKSTILDGLTCMFRSGSVFAFDAGVSKAFALEGADTAELLKAPDATKIPVDTGVFKAMSSGESVMVNKKGIKQVTVDNWNNYMCFACNTYMAIPDVGDIARRFCYFGMLKAPDMDKVDTELKQKIMDECPLIVPFLVKKYHALLKPGLPFWSPQVCGQELIDDMESRKGDNNAFAAFLNLDTDTAGPSGKWVRHTKGKVTKLTDLKQAYANALKFNDFIKDKNGGKTNINWDMDIMRGYLQRKGFSIDKVQTCKSCGCKACKNPPCCKDYEHTNRTNIISVINMELVDNKDDPGLKAQRRQAVRDNCAFDESNDPDWNL